MRQRSAKLGTHLSVLSEPDGQGASHDYGAGWPVRACTKIGWTGSSAESEKGDGKAELKGDKGHGERWAGEQEDKRSDGRRDVLSLPQIIVCSPEADDAWRPVVDASVFTSNFHALFPPDVILHHLPNQLQDYHRRSGRYSV
jgi:hypothetical protein